MTDRKQSSEATDDTTDYPRHTPGQAEGTVEEVEGSTSKSSDPKQGVNPEKPSQAEGAPEDSEAG